MANNIPLRHQQRLQQNTPKNARIGGAGFTIFQWEGQTIGTAQAIGHTSPQPVAQAVSIHPMDRRRPLQVATTAAIGPGILQLQMYEFYGERVWDRIMQIVDSNHAGGNSLNKYNDLAEIFLRLASLDSPVTLYKIIEPPAVVQSSKTQFDADVFHNCVITDIRDDESVDVARMEIIKAMTVQYTHKTRATLSA